MIINPMFFDAFAFIASQAHLDACAHGLWDDHAANPKQVGHPAARRRCTLLIREEVAEMYEAAADPVHFAEELADVVIMCMSTAGHLGIDLAAEVKHKMAVNRTRPYRHQEAQNRAGAGK